MIPSITNTSQSTVEAMRLTQAVEDLERYCKIFHIDFPFLHTEMMERITTGVHWRDAIAWAKERVIRGHAQKLPPKKKEFER